MISPPEVYDLKGLHKIVDETIKKVIDTKAVKTQQSLTEDILRVLDTLSANLYIDIIRRELRQEDKYIIYDLSGRLLNTTNGRFPEKRVKNLIMYLNDPVLDQKVESRYREFIRFFNLCDNQKHRGIVECLEKGGIMDKCGSRYNSEGISIVSCMYERHLSPIHKYLAK